MSRSAGRLAELCESRWFCFLIIVAVSFLTVMMPVLVSGLHASGDLGIYLGFAQEVRLAIENGSWFPGWANDNLGFGSVGIRFYPPISFYTSALLSFLIRDWYYVVCTYFLLWMIPGCWGIYIFLRQWVTGAYALLGAVLYAVTPFHLAEIYQFSLYAEFAAGGILPYCFLYATRISRGGNLQDVLGLSVSCAALILTHIPTTIIGAISLGVFAALQLERKQFLQTTIKFAAASLLALAASSLYWVRLVNELSWVAHNQPFYSSGLASYTQWLFPHLLFAANSPDYYAPTFRSFDAIIVLTGGLFLPSLIALVRRRPDLEKDGWRVHIAGFLTGMFGIFMLSHASSFIWARIETLQKIQFPWRFLTVVSVLGVFVFVIATSAAIARSGRGRTIAVLYLVLISGLILAYDLRKSFLRANIVSRAEFQEVLNIKDRQAGNSFAAWWPVWAKAEALSTREKVSVADRDVQIVDWAARSRKLVVGPGPQATATIATFYYPHWKARGDGAALAVDKGELGLLTVALPSGAAEVILSFEEPLINRLAVGCSIATWALVVVLLAAQYRRRRVVR